MSMVRAASVSPPCQAAMISWLESVRPWIASCRRSSPRAPPTVSTQPRWPQPQSKVGMAMGGCPARVAATGPCPHSPAKPPSALISLPSTTRPPPTPVPRIAPKTMRWPRPAPIPASASAKQSASLAITTGRCRAASSSAASSRPSMQGMLAHLMRCVSGSMTPVIEMATRSGRPPASSSTDSMVSTKRRKSVSGVVRRGRGKIRSGEWVMAPLIADPPMSKQTIMPRPGSAPRGLGLRKATGRPGGAARRGGSRPACPKPRCRREWKCRRSRGSCRSRYCAASWR